MSALIAALDGSLAITGEDIKLRRSVGTVNKAAVVVGPLRARVLSPTDKQLAAGFSQDDFFCIFSPTEINNAQWPGGQLPGATEDVRIPSKNKGDDAFIRGRWRRIEWAQGFYPGGGLCRIEMRVLG